MAGYIYLVVKLTRSLKSDIIRDKPNNSIVDVAPVGGPLPTARNLHHMPERQQQ